MHGEIQEEFQSLHPLYETWYLYIHVRNVDIIADYTLAWLLFFAPLGGPIGAAAPNLADIRVSNFIMINYLKLILVITDNLS